MPKKTIVLGLGGTGDWVLTFLKSRLHATYGEENVKDDVQFLLVDTIHGSTREDAFSSENKKYQVRGGSMHHEEEVAHLGSVRVESHEYLPLTGGIHQLAESIRQGSEGHTRHLSWFQADYYLRNLSPAAMNITDGAGQWRQFGRIAMVLSAEKREIIKRIENMIRNANLPHGDTLMFYVVCSLAGGTGAGALLDAAALIRETARSMEKETWIVAFLVLPSAFRNVLGDTTLEATKSRSYAAYRELVRFQTVAGGVTRFPIRYSPNLEVQLSSKLFDTVFLLDGDTTWKNMTDVPPWSGISPSIADGLEVFTDRSQGGAILQDLINASARMSQQVQLDGTLPAQFHSMGSYRIVLPARQYAAVFCSRFVIEFLDRMLPTVEEAGLAKLASMHLADEEYESLAQEYVRKIPKLFTRLVDLLPGRKEREKKLRTFAALNLDEHRTLLRPTTMPEGSDLQILINDPLKHVATGKDARDMAADAALRINRECDKRLKGYWEKVDNVLRAVVEQLGKEIATEVVSHTRTILNRQDPELREHPVGSAVSFLTQVTRICDELLVFVLGECEKLIDSRQAGQNSPGHWETLVSGALTQMEAMAGQDSWLNRGKAWKAQACYIDTLSAYVERQKLARVFTAYRDVIGALKQIAGGLSKQILDWSSKANRSDEFSARVEAEADIAHIEAALRRSGQSFTSSFGLQPYVRNEDVDITMGGYSDNLYIKHVQPLIDEWTESPEWELEPTSDGHGIELVLDLAKASGGIKLRAVSGKELYQQVFDAAREVIYSKITSLSIFDYFLDSGFTAEQVADFLMEHSGPLIGDLIEIEQARAHRQIHLLAKKPANPNAGAFLSTIRDRLRATGDVVTLQESQADDYENPYTITLLHIVQDIRDGQLVVINTYQNNYYEQLRENDAYIVNHVFRSEQQAAMVEQRYLKDRAQAGSDGWWQMHPRIARLLEQPDRLKLFLQLWALGVITVKADPDDKATSVWMILPPGNDDPDDSHVVWLTTAANQGQTNLSPLLAMEQFCFGETSVRPRRLIKIAYESLEKALSQVRNPLVDEDSEQPCARLIEQYQRFLNEQLDKDMERGFKETHSQKEREALTVVVQHYLQEEIRRLG